jgi:hypothetical protein
MFLTLLFLNLPKQLSMEKVNTVSVIPQGFYTDQECLPSSVKPFPPLPVTDNYFSESSCSLAHTYMCCLCSLFLIILIGHTLGYYIRRSDHLHLNNTRVSGLVSKSCNDMEDRYQ